MQARGLRVASLALVVMIVGLVGLRAGPATAQPEGIMNLGAPGGIAALPSSIPAIPGLSDQGMPAVIGSGQYAIVAAFCHNSLLPIVAGPCPHVGGTDPGIIEFELERVWPIGIPAATFAQSGTSTAVVTDNSGGDMDAAVGVVTVQVNAGSGADEILRVRATDENGDARVTYIAVVDTMLAWGTSGAISAATQDEPVFISYQCEVSGRSALGWFQSMVDPDSDNSQGLDDMYDAYYSTAFDGIGPGLGYGSNTLFGDVDLSDIWCGGNTSNGFDDYVALQTDLGAFSITSLAAALEQESMTMMLALGYFYPPVLDSQCSQGNSVQVYDVDALWPWYWFLYEGELEGGCDLDGWRNSVTTTQLWASGDIGSATVRGQQGGGLSPLRYAYVTFLGPVFTVNVSTDGSDLAPGDSVCDSDPAPGFQCSLRAAIQESNASPAAETISIAVAAPISLSAGGLPVVTDDNLAIYGNGSQIAMTGAGTALTINAGGVQISNVTIDGADVGTTGLLLSAAAADTVLDGVSIRSFTGDGLDTPPAGGPQRNTIRNSTVSGNDARGIDLNGGAHTSVLNSIITDNGIGAGDSGIEVLNEDDFTISDNVLSGNADVQVSIAGLLAGQTVTIIRNSITGKSDGTSDGVRVGAAVDATADIDVGMSLANFNVFRGALDAGKHYLADLSPANVDAQYNDWNAYTLGEVENVVCHNGEAGCGSGIVDFDPFVGAPVNAMSLDCDPATPEVDPSCVRSLGSLMPPANLFSVSTNIMDASTRYQGYQVKVQLDPTILGGPVGITYTGLGGMTLDCSPVIGSGSAYGCSGLQSGTTTAVGQANLIGPFWCLREGTSRLRLVASGQDPEFGTTTLAPGGATIPTALFDASIQCGAVVDNDGDGCTSGEEEMGASLPKPGGTCSQPADCYSDAAWYDFYDVPVPANPDGGTSNCSVLPNDCLPNGPRSQAVSMADVLAALFYVGTHGGDAGVPNPNGVAYDSLKGSCDVDGDTVQDKEGLCYDRSPSTAPNPPWEAGAPNGAVNIADVLGVLAQVGLSCAGAP